MHILFLAHRTPYPPNKGEKIRTFHQIKHLVERGHRISVCTPTASPEDVQHLHVLEQQCNVTPIHGPLPGRFGLVKGLLSGVPLSVSHFYSRPLQNSVDRFLADNAVDAILCTSSSMAEYVFQSATLPELKSRPRLIMDFMDLDSDKWRQYERTSGLPMRLIFAREARLVARHELRVHEQFDACLFISATEADLFLQTCKGSTKVHVVGNGLDTATFRPAPQPKPTDGPNLLFTGVMDYRPNEDAVIWFVEHGWQAIRERHPNASFCIAGMNPSTRVASLARHPGVIVTGYVDDIVQYYDRAHIFIAPFRLARGVQNKVLQAFACGLPTITTPLGQEGIECRNGEHVLIAQTIEEMVHLVTQLVDNPAERSRIGANAAALIRRDFSWEGKLASLELLLEGTHAATPST